MYCLYYQAEIVINKVWFLTSILKSFEHLCFDRTLIKKVEYANDITVFEFFVPADQEAHFIELLGYFCQNGIVKGYKKQVNRLAISEEYDESGL